MPLTGNRSDNENRMGQKRIEDTHTEGWDDRIELGEYDFECHWFCIQKHFGTHHGVEETTHMITTRNMTSNVVLTYRSMQCSRSR